MSLPTNGAATGGPITPQLIHATPKQAPERPNKRPSKRPDSTVRLRSESKADRVSPPDVEPTGLESLRAVVGRTSVMAATAEDLQETLWLPLEQRQRLQQPLRLAQRGRRLQQRNWMQPLLTQGLRTLREF